MASGAFLIFMSLFLSTVVTQGIKIGRRLFRLHTFSFANLFVTGGMPSSHSALVFSLALSIYLLESFSTSFFIAAVFLLIVLRDAMGVRRSVGEEGKFLETITKKLKLKKPKMHVAMGHTPLQVFVGSLIGVVLTLFVFYVF